MMDVSTTRYSPAEAESRTLKANKACGPCRARKIKCDAAVAGLPCSSCTTRQCTESCSLLARKPRTRKAATAYRNPVGSATGSRATSDRRLSIDGLTAQSTLNHSNREDSVGEPDLLYVHILKDTMEKSPEHIRHSPNPIDQNRCLPQVGLTRQSFLSTQLSQLDTIDQEYLFKKGIIDLPPQNCLDTLVQLYFRHVHPFCPVISQADFTRCYHSGDCSLILLSAIITAASVHAPADVLAACGFECPSAAQDSLFHKTRMILAFATNHDLLPRLQASLVLCMVILDQTTIWDFSYWFHNSISLATRLNLRQKVLNGTSHQRDGRKVLKLYRDIWSTLRSLDIFHAFIRPDRSQILKDSPDIRSWNSDESDNEEVHAEPSSATLASRPRQNAMSPLLREMLCICGECLAVVQSRPLKDPREIMSPLHAWRANFATKMHVSAEIATDLYYVTVKAMSYRFECILCRLMRRAHQQSGNTAWNDCVKKWHRDSMLELDAISLRLLTSSDLGACPTPLMTTFIALLALHIESVLDPTESDLYRSMSRISIGQTMLVLNQGKQIPAVKRALPIFEKYLSKHGLYTDASNNLDFTLARPVSDADNAATASAPSHTQGGAVLWENFWADVAPLDMEFLGYDHFDLQDFI